MDREILESFLNSFQLLTPIQKKIWRYLQKFSRTCRIVFPAQATIASEVGCCRDTVNVTIKKFVEWEWLCTKKRCFRSNLYFMRDFLIPLDTLNSKTFFKPTEKPTDYTTVDPTLSNTYCSLNDVRLTSKGSEIVQNKDNKEQKTILESIGIFGKDLIILARYGLDILAKAVEDYKTRHAKTYIRNLAAWLTQRCQFHKAKKEGRIFTAMNPAKPENMAII